MAHSLSQALSMRPHAVALKCQHGGSLAWCHPIAPAIRPARLPRRLCRIHAESERQTDRQPVVPDTPPSRGTPTSDNGTSTSTSNATPNSSTTRSRRASGSPMSTQEEDGWMNSWSKFWSGPLPGRVATLIGLILVSRVGVYVRLPGVDVDSFANTMASSGLLGYVDTLSGGLLHGKRPQTYVIISEEAYGRRSALDTWTISQHLSCQLLTIYGQHRTMQPTIVNSCCNEGSYPSTASCTRINFDQSPLVCVTTAGGSISKVGLFSLGIIPYINASIVLQLFSAAFPSLKKMQREDGPQGRARFQYYQKLAAFVFAIAQAVGQLTYIRPYVTDFTPEWVFGSATALVAGAMALVYIADTISELKLGNGTSVLIFANIASSLPSSVGALLAQNANDDPKNVAIYATAFFLTTLGIIYVQEAERRIPVNYSNRYQAGALARQSYLPFKVNATGVMPLIFASSLLGLPLALARYTDSATVDNIARSLGPQGPLYLPVNIALIAFFNYYYTFLQLEPKELSENLKKSGAAIPGLRPGKQTAEYVSSTLTRMSILGSVFLGALSAAPSIVEGLTHLSAFRGFAGTSVLIMVGVATDTARRLKAEQAMAKYQDVDKLYDDLKL
eukprot:jgi/Chrzof1/10325/Cz04g37160.t1_SECY1[v5.2]